MPKAIEAEFHISMQAAFTACGSSWPPQSAGAARPFQPAAAQVRVGVLPAGRRGDVAVLEWCAELVADAIERRDHVAGEASGFLQHRIDRFLVEIAVKALGDAPFSGRRRA